MSADATNLFLLEDLESSGRTRSLADHDLNALRTTVFGPGVVELSPRVGHLLDDTNHTIV